MSAKPSAAPARGRWTVPPAWPSRRLAGGWNESAPPTQVGSAYLVFAAVDADGKPRRVPPVIPETDRDRRRYQEAQIRRTHRLARRRAIRELREKRVAEGFED